MTDQPTTARARRAAAVRAGTETDAVDRRIPRSNPGGRGPETTTRRRQQTTRRDVADEIGIGHEGVGAVDRINEGIDVFLRSVGVREFGENVQRDFADEADFVESDDVDPRIDGRAIAADPQIPTERRSQVADRARRGLADEDPFAQPEDFDTEVGAFGVTDARFSDIGARRRAGRQFAAETRLETVGPDEVVETDDGFGLADGPQRQLAAFDFADRTPVESFDPASDITPTDDGFGLTSDAQRRVAAREFESQFDLFGTGTLDPATDVRELNGGFGLGEDRAREVAAADLDEQLTEFDIGPDDIDLQPTDGGGFEAIFEREVRR